jgi:hypothetical protein
MSRDNWTFTKWCFGVVNIVIAFSGLFYRMFFSSQALPLESMVSIIFNAIIGVALLLNVKMDQVEAKLEAKINETRSKLEKGNGK